VPKAREQILREGRGYLGRRDDPVTVSKSLLEEDAARHAERKEREYQEISLQSDERCIVGGGEKKGEQEILKSSLWRRACE